MRVPVQRERRAVMRVKCLLLALVLAAGCEGRIVPGGEPLDTPIDPNPNPNPDPLPQDPPNVSCDPSQFPDLKLDGIASEFASTVYPALNRPTDGCVSCHAPNM